LTVKVKFFGSLAESLDRREAAVDFDDTLTVEGLWNRVTGQAAIPAGILTAVNMEYCELDKKVLDGDEVAYFPPVTGGADGG
jgi:molybdopterin synthase sulfur carrier subunit